MIGDPRFHPYNLAPAPKRVRFRVDYPKHKDHRFTSCTGSLPARRSA